MLFDTAVIVLVAQNSRSTGITFQKVFEVVLGDVHLSEETHHCMELIMLV